MELPIIVLAYAASALVAALATALFSGPIDRVLKTLIQDEILTAWSLFVKFGLFVATFTGGMPSSDVGKFVGFPQPVVTPPIPGDGTLFVMKSVGGSLLSASWFLLAFFAITLIAGSAARLAVAYRERREKEAREAEADRKARDAEAERRRSEAPRKEPVESVKIPEPPKRAEPEGRRPVTKEERVSRP
jgi:hypothetical protein